MCALGMILQPVDRSHVRITPEATAHPTNGTDQNFYATTDF
jgi:hypothetical protein